MSDRKKIVDEVDRLISKEIKFSASNEDLSEKYWATFKRFLKTLEAAREALREAQDCSYALGDSAIREKINEVSEDFNKIFKAVDEERDRINKIRFKPIQIKSPEPIKVEKPEAKEASQEVEPIKREKITPIVEEE